MLRPPLLASLARAVLMAALLLGTQNCGSDGPGYDDSPADDVTAPAYDLDLSVTTSATFGALQFEITHLGRSGGFIRHGDKLDCIALVDAVVAGNFRDGRTARVGLISLPGIRTPAAILRCGFRTREELDPASFRVRVNDASDTNSEAIDPPPTVVVSSVIRR